MHTETLEAGRSAIAAEVRAEIARQGLTQRDLGSRIGMTQAALQLRLAGSRSFRAEELATVATALGVPVAKFLPAPDMSPPAEVVS